MTFTLVFVLISLPRHALALIQICYYSMADLIQALEYLLLRQQLQITYGSF